MRRLTSAAIIAVAAVGFVPSANAGFLGNSVTGQWFAPNQSTPAGSSFTAVVGAGVEFPTGSNVISGDSFDLGDTTILMTQTIGGFTGLPFNGVRFSDTSNTIPDIIGVTINLAGSSYAGFDASRVSFDANNIWLNVQGLLDPGYVLLDVTFADSQSVPEPASMALFGVGLTGLALVRRPRKAG